MASNEEEESGAALPHIHRDIAAFEHLPEHGISLFLAKRTKTIHFIRHAEGTHNQANKAYGDDTPCIFSTPGAWQHIDALLTEHGIQQCIWAQQNLLHNINPELVVVSPFSRTLQTAHIMFGGKNIHFMVHHLCRERWGKFTCDKRRSKQEIMRDFSPVFSATNDSIDFQSFGYPTDNDEDWQETREPDDVCTARGIAILQWLATRPEQEIAVVTHSSWLKHLFKAFGQSIHEKDMEKLHRLAGNAEIRSVCLALHKGFYPDGYWDGDKFVPKHSSFRRLKYAPSLNEIADIHRNLCSDFGKTLK